MAAGQVAWKKKGENTKKRTKEIKLKSQQRVTTGWRHKMKERRN